MVGLKLAGERVPLEYKYYDCESKKEAVTSLMERVITADEVDFVMSPYSSGPTLAGIPVTESYGVAYMDHGSASDPIFQQGH